VAFEVVAQLAQLEQFAAGHEADCRPGGVQQRRGVALAEHEPIVVGVLRLLRIEAHLREEQRCHQIGRRRAGRRMAAAGRRRRADRVDAKLRGDVLKDGNQPSTVLRHGYLR
jgi:hypothetical protein